MTLGSRGGRIAAAVVAGAVLFGAGFAVGLATTAPQWWYDISYNPLVPGLIAAGVPLAIWIVDRTGQR